MASSGDNIRTIPWKGRILDTVRDWPGLYVGEKSLNALWFFLKDYEMAKRRFGQANPPDVPRHFADWVGYRLQLDGDRGGFWHLAIRERERDDAKAFDRFYELREEFLKREPRTVATVLRDHCERKVGTYDSFGKVIWGTELLPESLKIVVYTDDPGFFLCCDSRESFVDDGRFFPALSACSHFAPDRFEIRDEATWRRLNADDVKYKRNLARRRARKQKKAATTS